jgi:hypothetical protein
MAVGSVLFRENFVFIRLVCVWHLQGDIQCH